MVKLLLKVLLVVLVVFVLLVGIVGWFIRAGHHLLKTASSRASLAKDLEMGSLVQRLLLPDRFSGRIGKWNYKVVFRPHGAMSGDWACR